MIKVMCIDTHATGAQGFVILLHPTTFMPLKAWKGEIQQKTMLLG